MHDSSTELMEGESILSMGRPDPWRTVCRFGPIVVGLGLALLSIRWFGTSLDSDFPHPGVDVAVVGVFTGLGLLMCAFPVAFVLLALRTNYVITSERALTITHLLRKSVTYYNLSQCHRESTLVHAGIGDVVLNDIEPVNHWADCGFVAARDVAKCMEILDATFPMSIDVPIAGSPLQSTTKMGTVSQSELFRIGNLTELLEPDEVIVWRGKPGLMSVNGRRLPILVIAGAILITCVFGFWQCLSVSFSPGIAGCLMGIIGISVMVVTLLARDYFEWKHDSYIVTNSRACIARQVGIQTKVRWFRLQELPRIRRRENRSGVGDILLGCNESKNFDGHTVNEDIGFWGISNVRDVWDAIMLQLRHK